MNAFEIQKGLPNVILATNILTDYQVLPKVWADV